MVFNTLNKTFSLQTLYAWPSDFSSPHASPNPLQLFPWTHTSLRDTEIIFFCLSVTEADRWSWQVALSRALLLKAKGFQLTSLNLLLFKRSFHIEVLSDEVTWQLPNLNEWGFWVSVASTDSRVRIMYKLCHSLGGDDKVTVGSMLCFHWCVSPASWETRVGCIFSWGIIRGNLTYGGLVPKSCPTFATPWTVAHQPPLSMGFPRQKYWSGLPFPSPGDLPDPGINPGLLHCRWILYRLSYDWHITTSPETRFCHIWMEERVSPYLLGWFIKLQNEFD